MQISAASRPSPYQVVRAIRQPTSTALRSRQENGGSVPVSAPPPTGRAVDAAVRSRTPPALDGPARLSARAAAAAGNHGPDREAAFGQVDPETEAIRQAWGRRANSFYKRGSGQREFALVDGQMIRQGWGDRTEFGRGERIRSRGQRGGG